MVDKPSLMKRLTLSLFGQPQALVPVTQNAVEPLVEHGYRKVAVDLIPKGSSGTTIYSGYFDEEYLNDHRGETAADTYDKMRRGDAVVGMVLSAVKNPIKAAAWTIESVDDSEEEEKIAALVRKELFENRGKPWMELLSEALSCVDFGHSIFEVSHRIVMNDPEFGTYVGLRQAGFRSQRTIQRWILNPSDGSINSIQQWAFGDLRRTVMIPGEFLMVITLNKEGDNYEGIAMLRSCLGAWKRKQLYLKLMAIGIEKNAVPTPIAKVPSGKENSPEYQSLINALSAYTSHENAYLIYPEGWEIELDHNTYDPDKTKQAIEFENKEIVYSFLANFLLLGTSSGSGSFALSFDLSDFFLTGLEHVAQSIADKMQQHIVENLVDLNFGKREKYPQLRVAGISDKAGQEFANIISSLTTAGIIKPDAKLEDDIRERLGLPEKEEAELGVVPPPVPTLPVEQPSLSEIRLAEAKTVKSLITQGGNELRDLMEESLTSIGKQLAADLVSKSSSLPAGQKANATKKVKPKGAAAYADSLVTALAALSTKAFNQATKEVPGGSQMRLSERITLSEFDRLPKRVQKKIKAQSQLIVDTQLADLQKAVYFQFGSSVESSLGSDILLEADLVEAMNRYVAGPSLSAGAGNIASTMVNESRNAFFFDEETISKIESFTFTNGDPVSPICQDLNGTTFAADDQTAERYFPPLHHNAILTGTGIESKRGSVQIEQIVVGDEVLTHTGNYRRVTEWMDRFEDKEYFTLSLDNGKSVRISAEHPVLTKRGWVQVADLLMADEIICQEDLPNQS